METEAVNESTPVFDPVKQNTQQALNPLTLPDELWERIWTYLPDSQMQKVSRLSRQHLATTKSSSFRAQYFLAHHMPCQALFYASKRSQLFTPELIESLISQGAVMSRYFAHELLRHARLGSTYYYCSPWKAGVSSKIVLAVLCKAQELYGDNFDIFSDLPDADTVLHGGYDDDANKVEYYILKEIFFKGRFAPFCPLEQWNLDDSRFLTLLAMNPELIEQMSRNGYVYSREERDSIWLSVAEQDEYKESEESFSEEYEGERRYERAITFLDRFPSWVDIDSKALQELLEYPYVVCFSPAPLTSKERELLRQNGGLGPLRNGVKIVKRLFDEGKAFPYLNSMVKKRIAIVVKTFKAKLETQAAALSFLFKMSPGQSKEAQTCLAVSCMCLFEKDVDRHSPSASDLTTGLEALFKLFVETKISQRSLTAALADVRFAYENYILYAIEEDKLAALGFDDNRAFLQMLLEDCLNHPMTGNKLEEIERAYVELFAGEERMPSRAKRAREALAHDLSAALMQWQFDLETLKPDRGLRVEDRLRTPIAWMASGTVGRREESPDSSPPQSPSTDYRDDSSPQPQSTDFHEIVPREMPCYHCRVSFADLSVANFRQEAREEDVQEMLPAEKPVARKGSGWRYLCHSSDLPNINNSDDYGTSEPSSGTEDSEEPRTTPAEGKAGSLKTFTLHVLGLPRATSRQARSCHREDNLPFHPKAKELALVLPYYLAPTSSALRDVVLAHALVNGHEVLVEKLMSTAATTPAVSSTKCQTVRLSMSEQPVLPTLAHLRILQALERRPMPIFVDAIAKGAPFKRGHLRSFRRSHARENDWEQRDCWSAAKEDRNDRRLRSLFAERERLERLDMAHRNGATVQEMREDPPDRNTNIAQMAGASDPSGHCELSEQEICGDVRPVLDSETEGDADETEAEPVVRGTYAHKIMITIKGVEEESVSMEELPHRHRSLCLWVEHLRLLQWFEERKQEKQRQERETLNRSYCYEPEPSAFATSLNKMLARLDGLKASMEDLLRVLLETRKWYDTHSGLEGVMKPQTNSKKRKIQPGEEDLAVGRCLQGFAALAKATTITVERAASPESPCQRAKGDAEADHGPPPSVS